ncbi:ATP-binding protein [Telmatospirillum sp. J64-1]|uniref:sensor histidine kinase n=1 Tax=Telmatospirillum sp. J64-1 TaxID=2502183 RepID=UPI001C8F4885|nr:ATP-binding protein [Telmatospirillum sp. J64-1]
MAISSFPLSAQPRPRPRPWLLFALAALVLLLGALWGAGEIGRKLALAELLGDAEASATLHAGTLENALDKQRALPFILAQDPDFRAALAAPQDEERLAALNAKLESLSTGGGMSIVYLMDRNGTAIAASNWREPTSFVGRNYAFRPYFQRALAQGAAEHFAMGNVSHLPGVYLARRIDGPDGVLGVLVVKMDFRKLEADWRAYARPAFVADERGIILITSLPEWRFRTLAPIPPQDKNAIRASLQFGAAPLDPLPADSHDGFLEVTKAVASTPWTLHLLAPTQQAVSRSVFQMRTLALLSVSALLAFAALQLTRRERLLAHSAAQEAIRLDLENRVVARTKDLLAANRQLQAEMEERQRAEAHQQQLQDELVQANKLALLGQITASVAHEINQPVAAIRSYADNAALYLARSQPDSVERNLKTIAALTERIGTITDGLRAFSRKATGQIEAVSPAAAISGALLLLGHRLRQSDVELVTEFGPEGLLAAAERVRLEQVLVNLLQNSLDALAGTPAPMIRLSVAEDGGEVRITVADNGPGLPPQVMQALFTPFVTTKESGLGLGLVISHDILADFGGCLEAENSAEGGACFTLILPRFPS